MNNMALDYKKLAKKSQYVVINLSFKHCLMAS